MQAVDFRQIDSSYTQDFDLVIDASEGRLTENLYSFQVIYDGKPISVKIKAIGIGINPKVWLLDNVVLVQSNSGIWLLQPGSTQFKEVDFGYPLYDVFCTPYGLLVFHLLGCEMVSPTADRVIWRYLGGQLTDFSISGDTVSLKFDDEDVLLELGNGKAVSS